MDLYTLNENFIAKDVVDEYVSAIWTERYAAAGDTQIVVPATTTMLKRLQEGTYLGLRGSKEVMLLETQSVEDGLLTVVGKSLVKYLDERYTWFANPETSEASSRVSDYTDKTKKPGEFIADVVNKTVIAPLTFSSGYAPAALEWDDDAIPNLTLGPVDSSGTVQMLTAPIGPLYSSIQPLAEQNNVGISLYLASADPLTGFALKFTTYQGVDRTSDQDVNDLIRLSPNMETLSGVKSLSSIDGYKNVVYVYYQGIVTVHYEEPDHIPEGMARRVLVHDAEGAPLATGTYTAYGVGGGVVSRFTRTYVSPEDIAAFRAQQAKDALANHNHIHAIDGQTSPENDFVFGIDYGLGDLIELESFVGVISKARITEYIRTEDKTGERQYPTISVVS